MVRAGRKTKQRARRCNAGRTSTDTITLAPSATHPRAQSQVPDGQQTRVRGMLIFRELQCMNHHLASEPLCPYLTLALAVFPGRLRIGLSHHSYVYTHVGGGVYKCSRGSDYARPGQKLWLMRDAHGLWVAFDGPDNGAAPTRTNQICFTSTENILAAGWHSWMAQCDGHEDSRLCGDRPYVADSVL